MARLNRTKSNILPTKLKNSFSIPWMQTLNLLLIIGLYILILSERFQWNG